MHRARSSLPPFDVVVVVGAVGVDTNVYLYGDDVAWQVAPRELESKPDR